MLTERFFDSGGVPINYAEGPPSGRHTLSLVDYLRQIVTQSAIIALLVILPNALMIVVWYVLVGRRLYQLGRPEWHGFISPFTFLISLFSDTVHIYEIHNNGGWYNFGFLLGASIIFGGSGGGAARRRR